MRVNVIRSLSINQSRAAFEKREITWRALHPTQKISIEIKSRNIVRRPTVLYIFTIKIHPLLDSVRRERPISDYQPRVKVIIPQGSLSMHDIHECSDEEVITTWMTDMLSLSGELCVDYRCCCWCWWWWYCR